MRHDIRAALRQINLLSHSKRCLTPFAVLAVIYTLIESAKRCGANPYEYLRDVLARLPQTRHSEIPGLLPDAWLKSHADETGAIPPMLTYEPPSR